MSDIRLQSTTSSNLTNPTLNFRYLTSSGPHSSTLLSQDSTELTVELGQDDLYAFKRYPKFVSSAMTAYLYFTERLVTDMNSNPVIPAPTSPLPFPYSFYPDMISPSLLSYTIDLTSEILVLSFSDIVNASSLDIGGISLQSDAARRSTTELYVLSPDSSWGSTYYDSEVTVYLGLSDLNEIKKLRGLAVDQTTTYLTAEARTIEDMNKNLLVPIDPSQALNPLEFSPDTTRPILLSFELDMELHLLKINFSETVFIDTLVVTALSLQSTAIGGISYTLSADSVANGLDGPQTTLFLNQVTDVNALKLLTTLAQNPNSTFITITEYFVMDAFGNRIVPIANSSPLQVAQYFPDITGPYLLGFDLDIDSAVATLSFDEPVSYNSLVFSKLRFHSDSSGLSSVVSISNGTRIPPNGLEVKFELTVFTLNQLKLDRSLATLENNTYISIQLGAIYDLALVRNPAFENTSIVTLLTTDATPPNLLYFHTDMNAGVLTLNFDEVIDASTLDPLAFILISSRSPTETHTLTGGDTASPNGLQILLNLTVEDLNILKQMEQLYTERSNSYLTFSSLAIADMFGNPVTVIPTSSALLTSVFINDTTRPVLRTFYFDLNLGQLTLNFYETIDISTLKIDQITLQQSSNSLISHRLTSGYVVSLEDDTSVTFNLTLPDLNRIKALQVALNPATTWLTLTNETIKDMNGRRIVEIINGYNARLVTTFTPDITSPMLLYYDLSINNGTIMLYFSETVNADSLDVTQLTIQPTHNETDPFLTHSLSLPSHTPTVYSPNVLVYLSEEDLNEIKRLTNLAVSSETTFLSITASTIRDMSENPVTPVSELNALQVTVFASDLSPVVLRGFDFDLNSGVITLNFSEPVFPSTLNISQFLLVSQSNITLRGERLVLFGSALSSEPTTSLRVQLSIDNLNEIKRLFSLATAVSNTFLSITKHAIQDTNYNYVVAISPFKALQVTTFLSDITLPQPLSFDLDLSNNTLTLFFDETINASSLMVTELTFFGTDNFTLGPEYTLSGGITNSNDGTVLVVGLIRDDLNALKEDLQYYNSDTTTFVFPTSSFITDMSGNLLSQPLVPLTVSIFYPDLISPRVESASLDMNLGILVLYYDEVVLGSSLNVVEVFIQARVGATANEQRLRLNRTLGSADQTGTTDVVDSAISIRLGANDLNELKRLTRIALSLNSSYISFSQFSIVDTNGNKVVSRPYDNPVQVISFLEDVTRPRLLAFDIDMDYGLLNLTFDETINVSSLAHTEITLQGTESFTQSTTHSIRLSGGTTLSLSDSTEVQFSLTAGDLNQIKFLLYLATSANDTYIAITNHTIRDMNNNYVREVSSSSAIPVTGFKPDTTRPNLNQFTLDMNLGLITFWFSETVNASSLYVSAITLQDLATASSNYTLTDSTSSQTDATTLHVYLSFTDLNAIKSNRYISTSRTNTFISFPQSLVLDMIGNWIDPRPDGIAIQASNFTRDSTRPVLEDFSLDMNTGITVLTFSETIDTRSFNVTQITLQSSQIYSSSLTDQTYTLRNTSILREDYYIIPIQLEYEAINSIKQLSQLATSIYNTFIAFPWTAFRDMFGNQVQPIYSTAAKMVLSFTEDMTRPHLLSGRLNMHDNLLTMTFSEMVNQSSLSLNHLTLYNSTLSPSQSHSLTSVYSFNSTYEGTITLTASLSLEDTNRIKMLTNLATGLSNTYLSITELFIRDMNANSVYNISQSNSIQIYYFKEDLRKPILESFSLDLTTDVLSLSFSETVNHTSFDVTGLSLLNPFTNTSWRLTSGTVLTQWYSPVLEILLHNQDLNYIKLYPDLATSSYNTYLSARSNAVSDMNGNYLTEITAYDPLTVTDFTQDLVRPNLTSFSLSLNTAQLNLTFTESVNVSSLYVSQISIQNAVSSVARDTINLTPGDSTNQGSFSTSPNWPYLTIEIGDTDLNLIKFLSQLATTRNNTYIRLTQFAIQDMNGNMVNEIPNGFAYQAANYIPDTTNPDLTSFSLNLNTGTLRLTFSETVNTSSLSIDSISLLDRPSSLSPLLLSLSGGIVLTLLDSTVIDARLTKVNLDTLKRERGLVDSVNTTYLAIQYAALFDMNGNFLNAITMGNAIKASDFIPDTTRPALLSYDLDMDNALLTISFSETVESDSLLVDQLTLQNAPTASRSVSLSNSSSHVRVDSTVIFVNISFEDLSRIKLERSIASVANGTNVFLTFTNHTIQDMNGNYVIGKSDSQGVPVNEFTEDTTSPVLSSFSLDMNTGLLNMTFNEVVDSLTYNATDIYIQQHQSLSNYSEYYRITSQSLGTGDGLILSQLIQKVDLNRIKTLRNLSISSDTTHLSISSYLVRDMNQNPVSPIPRTSALITDLFVEDMTRPILEDSTLNMNLGLLILTFDESMDTIASLDVSQIGFSSIQNGSILFSLSSQNQSYSLSLDVPTIEITIGDSDLNELKRLQPLASSKYYTYISLSGSAIKDTSYNFNRPVPSVQISIFYEDSTPPRLEDFSIDLTLELLTLFFSETVLSSFLNINQLTFVSQSFFPLYSPVFGRVLSPDGTSVVVELDGFDLNNLKLLTDQLTMRNNTLISVTSSFIQDMNSNFNIPIQVTSPLRAKEFRPDMVAPQLLAYTLDMDLLLLKFSFDEPVLSGTLNISLFTILPYPNAPASESYSLTGYTSPGDSYSSSINGLVIRVVIGSNDANQLKYMYLLAQGVDSTYLSFPEEAIQDMNMNPVLPIRPANASNLVTFVRDVSSPILQSFSLDLSLEIVRLTFDETINVARTVFSGISLQQCSACTGPSQIVRLTSGFVLGDNSTLLILMLSKEDLHSIKLVTQLATVVNNTYIHLLPSSVQDMALSANQVPDTTQRASSFTPDSVSPNLTRFLIDITREELTLVFDEPVNSLTLNTTAITFLNGSSLSSHSSYTLTGGTTTSVNGLSILIQLTPFDITQIKLLETLLISYETSFLSITRNLILDMNRNQPIEILPTSPLPVSFFLNDTVSPYLIRFDLDMDTGHIVMYFQVGMDYIFILHIYLFIMSL